MNRNTWIIIGLVILVLVGAGLGWMLLNQPSANTDTTPNNQSTTESQNSSNGVEQESTSQNATTVTIQNFAFSPANIKVKKGTTVTWVNQDTVGHNVVASDANNTGGLPTSAPLLAKGESFSFTFDKTGTFPYLCAPHAASMKGTVEVTE